MENNRVALWVILICQILFLIGSVIDPPTGFLMIILRVLIPLVLIVYFGFMIGGYIKPRKK